MSAGMAEVIAAHALLEGRESGSPWMRLKELAWCSCGHDHGSWIDAPQAEHPDWDKEHAAHVAEELAKAGYGNVADAWDEGATAGWKQTGEGFNAEYPDESTGECSVDLSANPYRESSHGVD